MAQRLESSGVQREFDASEIHFGLRYRSPTVIEDPDAAMRPGKPNADWRPAASPATAPRTRGGTPALPHSTCSATGPSWILRSAARSASWLRRGRPRRGRPGGSHGRPQRAGISVWRQVPHRARCTARSTPLVRLLMPDSPHSQLDRCWRHHGRTVRTQSLVASAAVAATALMVPPTPHIRSPRNGCLLNQQTPGTAAMAGPGSQSAAPRSSEKPQVSTKLRCGGMPDG